jgi:hypothetical protein
MTTQQDMLNFIAWVEVQPETRMHYYRREFSTRPTVRVCDIPELSKRFNDNIEFAKLVHATTHRKNHPSNWDQKSLRVNVFFSRDDIEQGRGNVGE